MKRAAACILVGLLPGQVLGQASVAPTPKGEITPAPTEVRDAPSVEVVVPPVPTIRPPSPQRYQSGNCIEEVASWGRAELDDACTAAGD
jgi:hypothetical protein